MAQLNAEELRQSAERQHMAAIQRDETKQKLFEQQMAVEYAAHNPTFCHPRKITSEEVSKMAERQLAFAGAQLRRRAESFKLKEKAKAELAERKIPAFTKADVGRTVSISGTCITLHGTKAETREVKWSAPQHNIEGAVITSVQSVHAGNQVIIEKPDVFPPIKLKLTNPSLKLEKGRIKEAFERNHAFLEAYRQRKEELKRRIYPPDENSPRLSEERRQKVAERMFAVAQEKRKAEDNDGSEINTSKILSKERMERLFGRLHDQALELRLKHEQLIEKKRLQEEADISAAISRTAKGAKPLAPAPPKHRKPPTQSGSPRKR